MAIFDQICSEFLKNKSEITALNLLKSLRENQEFNLGIIVSEYLNTEYPDNYFILENYASFCFQANQIQKAYDIYNQILSMRNLKENQATYIILKQQPCLEYITNRYIYYNKDKVEQTLQRTKRDSPLITLTITTCKRIDLFEKTMNSVLNCFEDLDMIDYFFCIDDNSSEEDRKRMRQLYPFFTFYFKNQDEKGHIKSTNLIRKHILNITKTPYILHLEDDWRFFCKRNYINDAFEVLNDNHTLGQCLFNKNYIEIEPDVINVKGGEYHMTKNGFRYYIHEYNDTEEKQIKWINKHGNNVLSSSYWPHFSLRPSLMRSNVLQDIGEFNLEAPHFEMEYAYRYIQLGYISAFFENIYCIHMGRLTSQIKDKNAVNAYKLNNEKQFDKDDSMVTLENNNYIHDLKLKTYVLNLDRRQDRWKKFIEINDKELNFLKYQRFSAVDGNKIKSTTQLQRIFNNNDYNMKVGMVGCLMSHVKMYIELINSDYDMYCILEDDIEVTPNFKDKFYNIIPQADSAKWDMIYLGHHLKNLSDKEYSCNKIITPTIHKTNVFNSFQISIGGTIGYIITKAGAQKLLDFISETGATNCIDTLQQKSSNILEVYYCNPHLVYSECYRGENIDLDTDIQDNKKSLTLSFDTKLKNELSFYKNKNINLKQFNDYNNIKNYILSDPKYEFYIYIIDTPSNIYQLINICNKEGLKHYTIETKALFIVSSKKCIERYYHSFKINNKYSINDCLL